MSDLSITASEVIPGDDADIARGTAGSTVTAGQPVYKDASDSNKLKPCVATAQATAECVGIALEGASDDQPLNYQYAGHVTLGATANPADGELYVVSQTNSGGIAPVNELTSAYITVLGVANGNDQLRLGILASGRSHVGSRWIAVTPNSGSSLSGAGERVIAYSSIPAGLVQAGMGFRISGSVRVSNATGAVTSELHLRMGGTASGLDGNICWTSGTFDAATDDDLPFTIGGNLMSTGSIILTAGFGAHGVGWGGAPGSAIATAVPIVDQDAVASAWTASTTLPLKLTWTFSASGNLLVAQYAIFEAFLPDVAATMV